jgi:type II secretory pathway component GspD/PulD (secretin)
VTQITPVFEGGSLGAPTPFTQYLQAPEVKTIAAKQTSIISSGETMVLGVWREIEQAKSEGQGEGETASAPAVECELAVLVTVHILPADPISRECVPAAPPPHEATPLNAKVFEVSDLVLPAAELQAMPPEPEALLTIKYKLRNIAAPQAVQDLNRLLADEGLKCRVAYDAAENTVCLSADKTLHERLGKLLTEMDKEAVIVLAGVTVVEVPNGFSTQAGLTVGGDPKAVAWAISEREAHMLNEIIRGAKGRGECDILARPVIMLRDRQTGSVRVGQQYPYLSGFDLKTAHGRNLVQAKKEMTELGVALDLTPAITADGGALQLRTEFRHTEVTGTSTEYLTVTLPGQARPETHEITVPTFAARSVKSMAQVGFGQTLVLAARPAPGGSQPARETLVIITPEIVKAQAPGWFAK